jgi:hypothetical protein
MRYPYAPGTKVKEGPSVASAKRVETAARTLRELVYSLFQAHPNGLTADECAAALNVSILSIRPRVAELHTQGKLCDSGVRRQNASRHNATVWRLLTEHEVQPSLFV